MERNVSLFEHLAEIRFHSIDLQCIDLLLHELEVGKEDHVDDHGP